MTKSIRTIPCGKNLNGKIRAISSKSDLHRLIFCACLADAPCTIRYSAELSKDMQATIGCFRALGAHIAVNADEIILQKPLDLQSIPEKAELDCGESGSTARFLLPLAALFCKNATLTGKGKLPARPFEDLCVALEAMGARFSSHHLPITVEQTASPRGDFSICGNVSSQYITGLLFILPFCTECGIHITTPLESAGYISLTADAMARFGVKVKSTPDGFRTEGRYHTPNGVIDAQGDFSNAAFWLCAAKGENSITVTGLDLSSSQPDRRVAEILTDMGMQVECKDDSVCVSAPYGTHGVTFDAREIPDLVPVLAVRAAVSKGETHISGISRLRIKESDRVAAVCALVTALGGKITSDEETMHITGVDAFSGGKVDSFNDHRIAMSAAVASVFSTGDVTICGAEAVEKSYPQFYEHFEQLTIKEQTS